jgi:hypothetical protein
MDTKRNILLLFLIIIYSNSVNLVIPELGNLVLINVLIALVYGLVYKLKVHFSNHYVIIIKNPFTHKKFSLLTSVSKKKNIIYIGHIIKINFFF